MRQKKDLHTLYINFKHLTKVYFKNGVTYAQIDSDAHKDEMGLESMDDNDRW
jgi:hypothetical protein